MSPLTNITNFNIKPFCLIIYFFILPYIFTIRQKIQQEKNSFRSNRTLRNILIERSKYLPRIRLYETFKEILTTFTSHTISE